MPLTCRPLHEAGDAAWDAFVAAHPDGTFFHRAAWRRVIGQAFGHRTHYLTVERDGALTGVLPLGHVRTALFGSQLVSVPFCVYGGPLAADRASFEALLAAAAALMPPARAGALNCASSPRRRRTGSTRWRGRRAATLRHVPQADRRRRRGQPESHSAQAARHGAQGHRPRPCLESPIRT